MKLIWQNFLYIYKSSAKQIFTYFDISIDVSFQGVNRLFVWLFKNQADCKNYERYYFPIAEIKKIQFYDQLKKSFKLNSKK